MYDGASFVSKVNFFIFSQKDAAKKETWFIFSDDLRVHKASFYFVPCIFFYSHRVAVAKYRDEY